MKKLFLICLLAVTFFSCDELTKHDDDDSSNDQILEYEKIEETQETEFDGENTSLSFENGALFKFNSSVNSETGKIKIYNISNDRFFNTEGNLIFDFSDSEHNYFTEFSYKLPTDLIEDDINAILYYPKQSDNELEATKIDINYDKTTGQLLAQFYIFSGSGNETKVPRIQENQKYNRLVISWSDRNRLSEYPEQKIIKMPYYAQPSGSCWATSATMLSRAYSPNKDHTDEIRIIDFVKLKGDDNLNEGIGLLDFRNRLTSFINNKTNLKTEVSTFFSQSNMLNEITKKLDNNIPLILNLDFPDGNKSYGHAVVVIGYRRDLVSASKVSMELLIHNPGGNVVSEEMYRWVDYDWLMSKKSYTEAFQILYPDIPVLAERPLQTCGMPINSELGTLGFVVKSQSNKEYTISMNYNREASEGYKWYFPNGTECKAMPDSTDRMLLKIPIYNADDSPANLSLGMRIYNNENGELMYDESTFSNFPLGLSKTDIEISLSEFTSLITEESEFRSELEIRNTEGKFLDGYTIKFKLTPRNTLEVTMNLYPLNLTVLTTVDGNSSTSESEGGFGANKVLLTGNGKTFSGTKFSEISQGKRTDNLTITFDKEVNPTKISRLTLETIMEIDYLGSSGTNNTILELTDISIKESDKVSSYLDIERYGNDVCNLIGSLFNEYESTDGSNSTTETTDYRCTSDTELYITIK